MGTFWEETSHSPPLVPDEAQVWAVSLDRPRARCDELWATLSADEQHRADEFRHDDPRRRFVVARAALRMLLGKYLGVSADVIRLTADTNGKPRLADRCDAADVQFNVTHSGELSLVTVAIGCEVGVDVERLRPVRHAEQIARRYFHPAEIDALAAAAPVDCDEVFMRCWTGKEAVLKAVGSGITGSLSGFRVPTHEHDGVWIELASSRCWLQQLTPAAGYVGAVACLNAQRSLRCFEYIWDADCRDPNGSPTN